MSIDEKQKVLEANFDELFAQYAQQRQEEEFYDMKVINDRISALEAKVRRLEKFNLSFMDDCK